MEHEMKHMYILVASSYSPLVISPRTFPCSNHYLSFLCLSTGSQRGKSYILTLRDRETPAMDYGADGVLEWC